jgi:hypothetical protein
MIWTLTIKLLPHWKAENEWKCELEIDSSKTLPDLHLAIQKAVDFESSPLYEFYVAKSERSRVNRIRFVFDPDDNEKIEMFRQMGVDRCREFDLEDSMLSKIFPLPEKMKLFCWFDYEDDWRFQISKKRTADQEPKANTKYPRVVKEEGIKPIQYDYSGEFDDE